MKWKVTAAAALGMILLAAQAQGEGHEGSPSQPAARTPAMDSAAWLRPLQEGQPTPEALPEAPEQLQPETAPINPADIDVVDAHWMALTMWGEGRSQGESGMRAVGHVIHNRLLSGKQAFVTDTVSEAWQFSCWNKGDPNRAAMLNIDALPADSRDRAMWQQARAIADEILSGRSQDPTGGALFYHTTAVAPKWSAGLQPIRTIGNHLFFRAAR